MGFPKQRHEKTNVVGRNNRFDSVSSRGGIGGGWQTERAVAEWVIQRGGVLKPHFHSQKVSRLSALPATPFMIQEIDFFGTREIADTDVTYLKSLLHLHTLNLARTSITDNAVATIGQKTSLLFLHLNYTQVSDKGLKHLRLLNQLEMLTLRGTAVSDSGMRDVSRLLNLVYLDVSETRVTDRGLEHLASLTRLRTLKAADTNITDTGIGHLRAWSDLKKLDLSGTKISDAGIDNLARIKTLAVLTLKGTGVTSAGLQRLTAALPECRIEH